MEARRLKTEPLTDFGLTADFAFVLDQGLIKARAGIGRGRGNYHLAKWLPALVDEFADFVLELLRFGGRNQVVPFDSHGSTVRLAVLP